MSKKASYLALACIAIIALYFARSIYLGHSASGVADTNFDLQAVDEKYRPYVLLAAKDFTKKQGMNSVDLAMKGREVFVERIQGDICVKLVVTPPGMGESPEYCYDEETSRLTRKFDDVE